MMEKHVAQIFDEKQRIIEQALQECHLWEHHLFSKLILNGIIPPPWLCNSALHSLPSDPKELNQDDIVSGVQLSHTQFGVPYPGHNCSLYGNVDVVSGDVQYPIGLGNEVRDFKKDCVTGDGLSNLPDYSANNAECASSGPPELDHGAISPHSQVEPRASLSYHDPAASLAKLQRSRSRQKALELRTSAKASKRLSGDETNTGGCDAPGPALPVVGSFGIEKDPGICSGKTEERLSRSGSGKVYLTRNSMLSKSLNSKSPKQSSNCSESAVKKSQTLQPTGLVAGRLFSSPKYSQLDREDSINSAENGNIAALATSRNSEAVTGCTNEGSLRPTSSSNLNGGSLLAESYYIKAAGAVKVLDVQENIQSGANPIDNTEHRSAATVAKVQVDFDGLVEKNPSCLGSRLTIVNPKDREDVSVLKRASDFVMPVMPKQLVFDDVEDTRMNEIFSPDLKEGQQGMLPAKESLDLLEPLKLPDNETREVLVREGDSQMNNCASHFKEEDTARVVLSTVPPNIELPIGQKELRILSSSFMNHSSPSQVGSENSSIKISKEPMSSRGASINSKLENDVEDTSMNGISSPDLKEGRQGMLSAKESLDLSEPLKLPYDETREVLFREGDSQMNNCARHFKEEDTARVVLSTMLPNIELPIGQKELCILSSSFMNHSSPSQVGPENSLRRISKEAISSRVASMKGKLENDESSVMLTDSFSDAVTENGLHKYADESVANFVGGFPYDAPTDEVNVDLAQSASNTISLTQNGDLSMQALLHDRKVKSFSSDIQNLKCSTESFTYDVEHSCPQHKRRKIEMETEKFLRDSTHLLENPPDSIDQRPASGTLGIEEDNPEAVLEVQHLPSDQEDYIRHEHISNSPTNEVQESQNMEDSLHEVIKEKVILDGRGRISDTCMLAEANSFSFCVDSTMNCIVDNKVESWHLPIISGIDSAEHTYGERSTSNQKTYPGENADISDGLPISPGTRYMDLMGTDETLPEFEGFVMPTDNAQSCIIEDEMELENMNNSVDCTSLGKSRFTRSSFCYSSTPGKFDSLTNPCQSLPNGLLEGYHLRTPLPLNNGSPRAFSDCLPICKGQYTSAVQTLWDRINLNFGSSGKRKSLKSELPCIREENENVDEVPGTFQKGTGSDEMTRSITQGPLAETIENANPSRSILQDDEDLVGTECSFGGTQKKIKRKLDKQDGYRTRFTSKGKENQSISLGINGAKRTSESVRKRFSRPKSSGKDSLKQRPTFSGVKSTRKNIVSNVTSFIPLVQQKQAAAVFTGKRDIKVKALEAAEAAKRMAEKKENERKMKKEALKIERERLEKQNLELQKKKKEEERKKKEAEMAAKKRQREDEEKKEKERKRKRVNDVKQQQQQEHKKMHARKEIEAQHRATGEEVHESRKFMDERNSHNNVEKISETEPLTIRDSANDKTMESCPEYSESVSNCANNGKATVNLIKAIEDDDVLIKNPLQEQSYEISPYKGSDNEDEDEDDVPNNKFIPSWASKHRLSMIVSSQKVDPETIFPRQSFCNIAEVLLPRNLRL